MKPNKGKAVAKENFNFKKEHKSDKGGLTEKRQSKR